MVDFKKRLAGRKAEKPTDPVKLYETLTALTTRDHSAQLSSRCFVTGFAITRTRETLS